MRVLQGTEGLLPLSGENYEKARLFQGLFLVTFGADRLIIDP